MSCYSLEVEGDMAGKQASMMQIRARSQALRAQGCLPPVADAPADDPLTATARLLCARAGRTLLGMVDCDPGNSSSGARRVVATSDGMAIIVMTLRNAVLLEVRSERRLAAIPNIYN